MRDGTEVFLRSGSTEVTFRDAVIRVQKVLAENYSEHMIGKPDDENERILCRYIKQCLIDERIYVEGFTSDILVSELYNEIARFSILTKYIYGEGIEEINVNSWEDIEVIYSDGHYEKTKEHFNDPEHALNVLRRMLHVSGGVIDNAKPLVLGHLGKSIRIAALKSPIVDEDVATAFSIRIVNAVSLKKEDFIKSKTATEKMLDFLSLCIRYGVGVCVSGSTSSGKTTLAEYVLSTIPNDMRTYTIETGSREFNLVKRDAEGRIVNRVVSTLSRESEDPDKAVPVVMLLDFSLRMDPDLIVIGEMRSDEAYTAQEAARTGHAVMTTIHANSAKATYRRMVTLCKRVSDLDNEELLSYVCEAFPIVVFVKKLQDKSRKIMEILECEQLDDGRRAYHTLFSFDVTKNIRENDKVTIVGDFKIKNCISESLYNHLRDNGVSEEEFEQIFDCTPDEAYGEGRTC